MPLRIGLALAVLLLVVVAPARAVSTSASVEYVDRSVVDSDPEGASIDLVILGEVTVAQADAAYGSVSARARYDVPDVPAVRAGSVRSRRRCR